MVHSQPYIGRGVVYPRPLVSRSWRDISTATHCSVHIVIVCLTRFIISIKNENFYHTDDENAVVAHLNNINGPMVTMENYVGWFSFWHEGFVTGSIKDAVKSLTLSLKYGASVCLFYFYGGTNFGFTAGKLTHHQFG